MSELTLTAQWVEDFTGKKIADGASGDGPDPEALAMEMEMEAAKKVAMLAIAHKTVAPVKGMFQEAMAHEVKVKGSFFKQKLLNVEGTQLDEAEFEEIKFSEIEFDPKSKALIEKGKNVIINQHQVLKDAVHERNGKIGPLFTARELEDGYWFPLNRERILPETFIAGMYSKTQRMLDETNDLYQAEVERKRERGELTPKANRVKDLVQSGADVMMIAGDMVAERDGCLLTVSRVEPVGQRSVRVHFDPMANAVNPLVLRTSARLGYVFRPSLA